ncbi:cytochrome P450 [Lentzea sp. NPDC051213]|uniref:cytochrome P450 n=1 Tax=Lentzea sp. NPDC051213 TaxID=3364126 RepID=UPI003793BC50
MSTKSAIPLAPGSLPLLGHTIQLLRNPLSFLEQHHSSEGIVHLRLGPSHIYLVASPELVRTMLVSNKQSFDKGGAFVDAIRILIGNGVGTCSNDEHRRQRPMLNPAFHRDRVAEYGTIMQSCAVEMASRWVDGTTVDVIANARELSTRIIYRTLFNTKAGKETAEDVERSLPILFDGLFRRMILPPLLNKIPTRANRRFEAAKKRVSDAVYRSIAENRAKPEGTGDLLSDLVRARDKEGQALTDLEVHDQVMTIFFAGTETTADALGWQFYQLSQNPDAQDRLYAELCDVLGDRDATVADLPNLPYLYRLVTESLRISAPSWLLSRMASADTVLGGYTIPRGANILFSAYCMHRMEDLYADPRTFDPDRWLPERTDRRQRDLYMPFGAGTRKCIGDNYAFTELSLSMAAVIKRWRLTLVGDEHTKPILRVSLSPSALSMVVERRAPAPPRSPDGQRSHQDATNGSCPVSHTPTG